MGEVLCTYNKSALTLGYCSILSEGCVVVKCGCSDTEDAIKRCRFFKSD